MIEIESNIHLYLFFISNFSVFTSIVQKKIFIILVMSRFAVFISYCLEPDRDPKHLQHRKFGYVSQHLAHSLPAHSVGIQEVHRIRVHHPQHLGNIAF